MNTTLELLFDRHSQTLYTAEKVSGNLAISKLLCWNVEVVSIIVAKIVICGQFLHAIDLCLIWGGRTALV